VNLVFELQVQFDTKWSDNCLQTQLPGCAYCWC